MPADPVCFTRESIEAHRGGATAAVAEQAVHSLALVEALAATGLRFRFKGGNSLLLLLDEPLRFSIDVDIATAEPRERIEEALEEAVSRQPALSRWRRRSHKTKPWLPLASFEVYYRSHYLEPEESFVFLDAQLKAAAYPGRLAPVRCGRLFVSDQEVEIATAGGILGDKLLTLGPGTLGIPVGKGKGAQRLKHVHDVAALAGTGPDLGELRMSVSACMEQENALQETAFGLEEVVRDTMDFFAGVLAHEREPAPEGLSPAVAESVAGIAAFREHLFSGVYSWTELRRDVAAAACALAAAANPAVSAREFGGLFAARTAAGDLWAKACGWGQV